MSEKQYRVTFGVTITAGETSALAIKQALNRMPCGEDALSDLMWSRLPANIDGRIVLVDVEEVT